MVHAEGLSPLLPAASLPECSLLCPDTSFQQSRSWEEEEELWGRFSQQPPALGSSKQGTRGDLGTDEQQCPAGALGPAAWCS